MNKKIIHLVVYFAMVAAIAACGDESSSTSANNGTDNTAAAESSSDDVIVSSSDGDIDSSAESNDEQSTDSAKSSSSRGKFFDESDDVENSNSATNSESISSSSSKTTATSSSSSSKAVVRSSSSKVYSDWHEYCLDVINNYRAKENLPPYTLADNSKQKCADSQVAADLSAIKSKAHFGDCGESAQYAIPSINRSMQRSEKDIINFYVPLAWNQKNLIEKGERDPNNEEDYIYISHYLEITSTKYTSITCASADPYEYEIIGWFNINYYESN